MVVSKNKAVVCQTHFSLYFLVSICSQAKFNPTRSYTVLLIKMFMSYTLDDDAGWIHTEKLNAFKTLTHFTFESHKMMIIISQRHIVFPILYRNCNKL